MLKRVRLSVDTCWFTSYNGKLQMIDIQLFILQGWPDFFARGPNLKAKHYVVK